MDGDQLVYELVSPTSDLARRHFFVGTTQNNRGQTLVGLTLTQTTTNRFVLHIKARDVSARPQFSNTLKVKPDQGSARLGQPAWVSSPGSTRLGQPAWASSASGYSDGQGQLTSHSL